MIMDYFFGSFHKLSINSIVKIEEKKINAYVHEFCHDQNEELRSPFLNRVNTWNLPNSRNFLNIGLKHLRLDLTLLKLVLYCTVEIRLELYDPFHHK